MFGIKQHLVNSAIDAGIQAATAKLEEFKKIIGDNDGDGVNDVDEVIAMVKSQGEAVKDVLASVDTKSLIAGGEKIAAAAKDAQAGLAQMQAAVNAEKLAAVSTKLKSDAELFVKLVTAGVERVKASAK